MNTQYVADSQRYRRMTTPELREAFLLPGIFKQDEIHLSYVVDLDRAVVGAAIPAGRPIDLPTPPELRCEFFCQRRELGILNIGGAGKVEVDGKAFALSNKDVLYVGRGSKQVVFSSDSVAQPARFYLLSYPAHREYETTHVPQSKANRVDLGSDAEANKRTIFQFIHENGAKSCQLVMGFTELATGSVWNTMPPHTHDRRSEVYMYFDVAEGHRVLHMMGAPQETRPLWVASGDVVLSPPWSIHCGAGTGKYSFCWGMGGENQRFDDMDRAPIVELL